MSNSKKIGLFSKSAIVGTIFALGAAGIYAGIAFNDAQVADNAMQGQLSKSRTGPLTARPSSGVQTLGANAGFLNTLTATHDSLTAYTKHEAIQLLPVNLSAATMARMELPVDFVPNNAQGSKENAPFAHIQLAEFSSGQKAIDALGDNLPAIAKWYGLSNDRLRQLLLTDSTVHLDHKGRMLHIDSGFASAGKKGTAADTLNAGLADPTPLSVTPTPYSMDSTFVLHSKPESTRVLYLNFVGNATYPAFSLDDVPSTFNDEERILIQKVWQRVAEDYAPFDVDVTTEALASYEGKIGATVLITPQAESAGGWGYLETFGNWGLANPSAFCFPNNLGYSEKPIAECVSHELGHTLGLLHQGTTSSEYYAGQGDGETGWAPIMGVSYYKNLTQWAKGEYAYASEKRDAYSIMAFQNLKARLDDHGNTVAFASALSSVYTSDFNNLSGSGIIETPGDVDVLSFVAGMGAVTFNVNPVALGSDLDIALQIIDANGNVLATANPESILAASITVNLPKGGRYFLTVTGAGKGDPLATGYTNYGSLGQYTVTGTTNILYGAPALISLTPSATVAAAPFNVVFNSNTVTSIGSILVSYEWNFGDGTIVPGRSRSKSLSMSHVYNAPGVYDAVLKIVDNRGMTSVKGVKITVN